MHRNRIAAAAGLLAALAFAGAGCQEEGPAERAGEAVDEALEDAGEATDEALEDAGEAIEETYEKAKEGTQEALD
jgi:hypothetical protein